jgi:hypothetical protein
MFSSSTSVKSVPVEEGAIGEGSTILSGALGDGGARCAVLSIAFTLSSISQGRCRRAGPRETHIAVTGPGIYAGLGESGLSEKGEKVEMRALADDGGLNGERTAIIMATHATGECWDEGLVGNETTGRRRDFRRCHATCAAGEQR